MKKLSNNNMILKLKSGLKAAINTAATKTLATLSEFHYCTDTKEVFIYNGTENVQIPTLANSSSTPFTGTFVNGDGDTVTIENGIIVSVT
jgi:hypothetical protein